MRYSASNVAPRSERLLRSGSRRATIWPLMLAILALLLAGLALAVDAALLWQARQELQVATDACSLAAVQQFGDDVLLRPAPGLMHETALRADRAARHYALQHRVLGSPLELQPATVSAPDVAFGFFDPLDNSMQRAWPNQWDSPHLNAVEITGRRARERGNAVGLFFGRFLRLPASDVATSATAVLDRQIIGFRPWGTVAAPVMPLALLSDPSAMDENSWEAQIDRPLSQGSGGQDHFTWDKQTRRWYAFGPGASGSDGLPEFTLRIPLHEGSGQDRNGKVLRFGRPEAKTWLRQVAQGLLGEDLKAWDGQFSLVTDGTRQVPEGLFPENGDLDALLKILEQLHDSGEPKVWPLYEPVAEAEQLHPDDHRPMPMAVVRGFVAARVAAVEVTEGNDPALILILQPTVLITSTALNDSQAERNPYVAKARLLK